MTRVLSKPCVSALPLPTALIVSISFAGISSKIAFNSFNVIHVILHVYMERYIYENKDDSTHIMKCEWLKNLSNLFDTVHIFELPSLNSLTRVLSKPCVSALPLPTALIVSISFAGISSKIAFNSFNVIHVILHVYMERYIYENKDDSTHIMKCEWLKNLSNYFVTCKFFRLILQPVQTVTNVT